MSLPRRGGRGRRRSRTTARTPYTAKRTATPTPPCLTYTDRGNKGQEYRKSPGDVTQTWDWLSQVTIERSTKKDKR